VALVFVQTIAQHTKEGFIFSHTHTHKIKTKRTIKITNPKKNIEKTKKKGGDQQAKTEINKNFKNCKKKNSKIEEQKQEK
jgi:hypothetical protein